MFTSNPFCWWGTLAEMTWIARRKTLKILSQLCPRIGPLVTEFPWRRHIYILHWYTRQRNGSQGGSPSQFNGKYFWGSTIQYICFDDNMLRSFFVCSSHKVIVVMEKVSRYLFLSGFFSFTVFWRIFLFRCWQVKCTLCTEGALIFYSMYFYTRFAWLGNRSESMTCRTFGVLV